MSCHVEDRVVAKIRERGRIGREEHGASMDRQDLSLRDWLLHHQAELLDAAQYVEAEIAAIEAGPPSEITLSSFSVGSVGSGKDRGASVRIGYAHGGSYRYTTVWITRESAISLMLELGRVLSS